MPLVLFCPGFVVSRVCRCIATTYAFQAQKECCGNTGSATLSNITVMNMMGRVLRQHRLRYTVNITVMNMMYIQYCTIVLVPEPVRQNPFVKKFCSILK
jgi:hypothetical protein